MLDPIDPRLALLLESETKLRTNKAHTISFSDPILYQRNNPVLFPKTINVIQGKAGVHKSRLAETICAALLKKSNHNGDLLEFHRSEEQSYALCYVDTERNLSDQFPYSLQQIQLKAGYPIETNPEGFNFISLLSFDREDRFEMLNLYLEYLRQKSERHLVIVLDVITDCVFNFNDSKDSMKLIDMMNQSINTYNVTFLCLIHENPGNSEKARGHLGTEILNKASTVLQIAFDKSEKKQKEELIRISYLKCRNSRKHPPFFAVYSESIRGLAMADPAFVKLSTEHHNSKVSYEPLLALLALHLTTPLAGAALYAILTEKLKCDERTIRRRLSEILELRLPIQHLDKTYYMTKSLNGRELFYFLE